MKRGLYSILIFCALTGLLSACQPIQPPGATETVRVAIYNGIADIDMGIPQQDVYVQMPGKPENEVYRITKDQLTDELRNATAWRSSERQEEDLFGVGDNPVGPYPKGEAHPFTFGEFISANATLTYTKGLITDHFHVEAAGLVPNSVYSMWCVMTWPPPVATNQEWPCGAPDGSDAVFNSSAEGTLSIDRTIPIMPYSSDTRFSSLCLAYHSDGETHGFDPGDYGKNTHIQLCWDVPFADSELWQNQPAPAAVSTAQPLAEAAIRDELMAMENRWWNECLVKHDSAACESMLADDFFFIDQNGNRATRSDVLAFVTNPQNKLGATNVTTEITAQALSPDIAVVGYGATQEVNGNVDHFYNTVAYKKVNGSWKQAYVHFMLMQPDGQ